MRITNTNLKELGLLAASDAEKTPTVQNAKDAAGAQPAAQTDGYFPSNELIHLTALATQEPEERPDVVRQVLQQMGDGAYSTPASAEQTADAILNAIE